jgi:hypothetical protein
VGEVAHYHQVGAAFPLEKSDILEPEATYGRIDVIIAV